tara:strand:- start:76214 stop:77371 length:1158 start_codon:yes stop_codon:yes gene_type:complete
MEVMAVAALVTFTLAFSGFSAMLFAKKRGLAKWLVTPARKSSSGAILLGGLVIYTATTLGMIGLSLADKLSYYHLFTWGVSGAILVGLGYLDDRKEIRPFAKLTGQFIASYIFANFCGFYLKDSMSMIFFNFFFIMGFAVFNGSNLIDGVDTISVKTSLISYLSYFVLGQAYNIESLQTISMLFMAPMIAFWFFNRSPSKIHIGEIGGGIIGLSMMFMSFVSYNSLIETTNFSTWQIAHLASFGLLLPVIELGVSFLRRLWAGRSPFAGDKLHLHHILHLNYKLSAQTAASIIALVHMTIQSSLIYMSFQGHPIEAFWIGCTSYIFFQSSVCFKLWNKRKSGTTPLHYVMDAIEQKNVIVIQADMMDEISFDISTEAQEDDTQAA